MTRGPTFWIVVLAIAGATAGLWLEHRRADPLPPEGITAAVEGDIPAGATFTGLDHRASQPLANWRGRRVLINYWATWCAPCRLEMPLLDTTSRHQPAGGTVILGVAEDTAGAVRAFLAEHPVSYTVVLADSAAPGGSLALGNTRRVLPYSVLIGEDGRILRRKVGMLTPAELDTWLAP